MRAARAAGGRTRPLRRGSQPRLPVRLPRVGPRPREYGTLSIISRKVVDALLQPSRQGPRVHPHARLARLHPAAVEFVHAERREGRAPTRLRRLVRVAFDGMFFRTTVLLRLIVLPRLPHRPDRRRDRSSQRHLILHRRGPQRLYDPAGGRRAPQRLRHPDDKPVTLEIVGIAKQVKQWPDESADYVTCTRHCCRTRLATSICWSKRTPGGPRH